MKNNKSKNIDSKSDSFTLNNNAEKPSNKTETLDSFQNDDKSSKKN